MVYFRERNNIHKEYSGHEDASSALRERLAAIVRKQAVHHIGDRNHLFYVDLSKLNHQTTLHLNRECTSAILSGSYDEAFQAFEIFLTLARKTFRFGEILEEAELAFRSAGSVYTIDDEGQVVLEVSEKTARNIETVRGVLASHSAKAADFFDRALHDLLSRERSANDVVKDFAIAMENYVASISGKADYKEALKELEKRGVIKGIQCQILTKLYAYRGDADGVAHAGNTDEPTEVDAMWFLETIVAQIKLIEAKLPRVVGATL